MDRAAQEAVEKADSCRYGCELFRIDDFGDSAAITENICRDASCTFYPWLNSTI